MSKEVPAAELGWFQKCNSCDHRIREALIYFSPCSLVKFSKDCSGEPLVIGPGAFIDESGKFNCPESYPEGGNKQERKSSLFVFLNETHESELVEKLLQVVGANYIVLTYSDQRIDVIDERGYGYHTFPMVKYRLASHTYEFITRNNLDIDTFNLDEYLEEEIAKDKAEIEKRKRGEGYVTVTADEIRAYQEGQKSPHAS